VLELWVNSSSPPRTQMIMVSDQPICYGFRRLCSRAAVLSASGVLRQQVSQRVQQEVAGPEVGCGGPDELAWNEFKEVLAGDQVQRSTSSLMGSSG
jgi:hypothetical protein